MKIHFSSPFFFHHFYFILQYQFLDIDKSTVIDIMIMTMSYYHKYCRDLATNEIERNVFANAYRVSTVFFAMRNKIADKNRIARIRSARRRKSTGTLNNILVTRDWLVENLRSVYRSVNRVTPTNPSPQSNANSNLFSFQGNRED